MNRTSSGINSGSASTLVPRSINSKARWVVAAAVAAAALSLAPQQAEATPVTASMTEAVTTTLISTQSSAQFRFIDWAIDIRTLIWLSDGTIVVWTGTFAALPATAFEDLTHPIPYAKIFFRLPGATGATEWTTEIEITGQYFDQYGLAYLTNNGVDVAYSAWVDLDGNAISFNQDGYRAIYNRYTPPTHSVPEPGTAALTVLAGLGLAAAGRRGKEKKGESETV